MTLLSIKVATSKLLLVMIDPIFESVDVFGLFYSFQVAHYDFEGERSFLVPFSSIQIVIVLCDRIKIR